VYLFAIVFYWTPPHFWSLSLLMKDEYAKVGVPMMPVVRGERETRRQIVLYTLLLYAVSQLPFCAGAFGSAYLLASIVLGLALIATSLWLYPPADRRSPLRPSLCAPSRVAVVSQSQKNLAPVHAMPMTALAMDINNIAKMNARTILNSDISISLDCLLKYPLNKPYIAVHAVGGCYS
jgi:hypothetical protein